MTDIPKVMFDNLPDRFVPEVQTERIFPLGSLDFVHNSDNLNVTNELLGRSAANWDDKRAILDVETGTEYSYSQLRTAVDKLAGGLRSIGVESGDRVLWRLPDSPGAVILPYAVWKLGGVTVPTILQTRQRELEYLITDTEATHVVSGTQDFDEVEGAVDNTNFVRNVVVHGSAAKDAQYSFEELLENGERVETAAPTAPFDAAVIYYTGGTTGRPKGCLGSHAGLASAVEVDGHNGRAVSAKDVFYTPAPVGHGLGNNEKINYPYKFGASVVIARGSTPQEWVETIEEYDVTIFAAAATMYRMMVKEVDLEEYDLSSVRIAISGGERLDRTTYEHWVDRTGVEIFNTLGMQSYLHWVLTAYHNGEKRDMPDELAVGKLTDGYEGKIVDVDDPSIEVDRGEIGKLAIRGPTNIAYLDNINPDMPEKMDESTHEGWGLTDDAFYRDEEGFLHFVTRLDDLIVSGGRQIAGAEVEEVLSQHELVDEVVVLGIPHEQRGQIVKAYVVPVEGVEPSTELVERLQDYSKSVMSPYKYPREIEFLAELPKNDVGKVQRAELRESA